MVSVPEIRVAPVIPGGTVAVQLKLTPETVVLLRMTGFVLSPEQLD